MRFFKDLHLYSQFAIDWRSRGVLLLCLAVSSFSIIGCGLFAGPEAPSRELDDLKAVASQLFHQGRPMTPADSQTPLAEDKYVFAVSVAVIPIAAPYGTISRTERLWRYLDEQVGQEPVMAALHHNGFRVGMAPVENWPEVRTVLREVTGKSFSATSNVTVPAVPLEIELKKGYPASRVFAFDSEGRLSGRDYPAGDAILSLNFRINPDKPGDLVLQAAPQVRTARRSRFEHTNLGLQRVSKPDYYTVGDLEFTIDIPQGQYVIIGPGAAVGRATSPGAMFLVSSEFGLKFESVIVIVPRVFATPATPATPPAPPATPTRPGFLNEEANWSDPSKMPKRTRLPNVTKASTATTARVEGNK